MNLSEKVSILNVSLTSARPRRLADPEDPPQLPGLFSVDEYTVRHPLDLTNGALMNRVEQAMKGGNLQYIVFNGLGNEHGYVITRMDRLNPDQLVFTPVAVAQELSKVLDLLQGTGKQLTVVFAQPYGHVCRGKVLAYLKRWRSDKAVARLRLEALTTEEHPKTSHLERKDARPVGAHNSDLYQLLKALADKAALADAAVKDGF